MQESDTLNFEGLQRINAALHINVVVATIQLGLSTHCSLLHYDTARVPFHINLYRVLKKNK